MLLMPANHSSSLFHYLQGRYGNLAWLVWPSARRKTKLRPWVPFALDNDAYSAWSKGREWDGQAWYELLVWAVSYKPLWALVPDKVADRRETLRLWEIYYPLVANAGIPAAFAVQDGMTIEDVPKEAAVVFVGGTTDWKWGTLAAWAQSFPRVHVGRVNEVYRLYECAALGVESVDGTGWFRDGPDGRRIKPMIEWLKGQTPIPPNPRQTLWLRR